MADPEKGLLLFGRQPPADPVAVAGLPYADFVVEVVNAALFDVQCHEQLGGALSDEVHEIERGLPGPGDAVDVPVLGSADDLRPRRDVQETREWGIGGYHLDAGDRGRRLPVHVAYLRQVRGCLAAAEPGFRVGG